MVVSKIGTLLQPNFCNPDRHQFANDKRVGAGAETLVGCPSVSWLLTPSVIRRRWRTVSHMQEDVTFPELRPKGGTSCKSGSWDTEGVVRLLLLLVLRGRLSQSPGLSVESWEEMKILTTGDTHYTDSQTHSAQHFLFLVGALILFQKKKKKRLHITMSASIHGANPGLTCQTVFAIFKAPIYPWNNSNNNSKTISGNNNNDIPVCLIGQVVKVVRCVKTQQLCKIWVFLML